MKAINYLDIFTMIPAFILILFCKNIGMTAALLFIGICGMIHHYYIDNNYLLCLDLIAISIGFIAYTYYSKIDKNIKKYLFILESMILSYFTFSMVFNVIPTDRILLLLIGLIWVPNLLFSLKHCSNFTIGFISLVFILYMYSRCLCSKHEYIKYTWPILHMSAFSGAYLLFKHMDMVIIYSFI